MECSLMMVKLEMMGVWPLLQLDQEMASSFLTCCCCLLLGYDNCLEAVYQVGMDLQVDGYEIRRCYARSCYGVVGEWL